MEALSVLLSIYAIVAVMVAFGAIFLDIGRVEHDKTYATLCLTLAVTGAASFIIAIIVQYNL